MAGQVDRDLVGGAGVPWACWRGRGGSGGGGGGGVDKGDAGGRVAAVDVRVLLTCSNHHRGEEMPLTLTTPGISCC